MGLFCKHKCQCRRRCDGWFGLAPSLSSSCRRMCNSGRTEFTKEEFLCTVNEVDVMRRYGYDPCPDRGVSLLDYVDPTGEIVRADEEREELNQQIDDAMVMGGVLIMFALLIFAINR